MMLGCLLFSTTPMGVRKITSPPSCVKKRRARKKKGGWVFAFQAYRWAPSSVGHGLSGNTLKVFKVFYI